MAGQAPPGLVGQCASMSLGAKPGMSLLGRGLLGSPLRSAFHPDPQQRFDDLRRFEEHIQEYVQRVTGEGQAFCKLSIVSLAAVVFVLLLAVVWLIDPYGNGQCNVLVWAARNYVTSVVLVLLSGAVANTLSPDAIFTPTRAVQQLQQVLGVYNLSCDSDGSLIVPQDLQPPRRPPSSSPASRMGRPAYSPGEHAPGRRRLHADGL